MGDNLQFSISLQNLWLQTLTKLQNAMPKILKLHFIDSQSFLPQFGVIEF